MSERTCVCGNSLKSTTKFCASCGAAQPQSSPSVSSPPPPPVPAKPKTYELPRSSGSTSPRMTTPRSSSKESLVSSTKDNSVAKEKKEARSISPVLAGSPRKEGASVSPRKDAMPSPSPRKEPLSRNSGAGLLRGSRDKIEQLAQSSLRGSKDKVDPVATSPPKKKESKGVFAGLLGSRFGDKKKSSSSLSSSSGSSPVTSGKGPGFVIKTSELSGFNMPLSEMRTSARLSPLVLPASPVDDDSVFVAPSQPGRRLRQRGDNDDLERCENCRKEPEVSAEVCECFLCERLVCQDCSRNNLCNVCAPRESWPGARAAFQRALESSKRALLARSVVESQKAVSQAIALNPQEEEPYLLRAECCVLTGDLSKALSDLTVAVELGNSLPALAQRMMLYWNEGETELARDDAATILMKPPLVRMAYARLQAVMVKEGVGNCLRGCDEALVSASGDDRLAVLLLRAWCLVRASRWGDAVSACTSVLAEVSDDNVLLQSRCFGIIGRSLHGSGCYKDAHVALSRAVEQGHCSSQLYLAIVSHLLNRQEEAAQWFGKIDRRDLQLAFFEWLDALAENGKDLCASSCVKTALLLDPACSKLVPEVRWPSLQRMLKMHALKNGNVGDDTSGIVHHPACVPVRVYVASTRDSLVVRAAPHSSVSSVIELARMMLGGGDNLPTMQLLDASQPRWLEGSEMVRLYEGELHLLQKPDGGRIKPDEVEIIFAPFAENIALVRRFTRGVTVMEVLKVLAVEFGAGPIGCGLWNGRNWLLPSLTLDKCIAANVFVTFLRYKATPCASAMLVEGFPVFCALSDCAFEVENGRLSAWGPGLGKFGYLPSGIPQILQSFEGERILALAAGLTHVAAITHELQVKKKKKIIVTVV
jgi:tetratricopeptide (TPR) repeat protein